MYAFYFTSKVFNDNSLLAYMDLDIPDDTFLERFGLDKEEQYNWKENFWERLFSENRRNMLERYFSDEVKQKINNELLLEGLTEIKE